MSLATLADYTIRYGAVDNGDQAKIEALLDDASSLVREVAKLTISKVEDDEIVLVGNGRRRMILPEFPVASASAVTIDGVPVVVADSVRVWPWGGIDLRTGGVWTWDKDIAITYTHGWDPTPPWIVALVCSMVHRAVRPAAVAGEQSITTGSQTVQYAATALGANVWLTEAEAGRLKSLRGPTIR